MKNKIFCLFLAVLVCTSVMTGCSLCTPETPEDDNRTELDKYLDQFKDEIENSKPEGDITEIWFEEAFNAYYPKQLKDIYFTKTYVYGDVDTEQPVVGLCSQKITEIKLYAFSDGALGEELFSVDELNPMEALLLYVTLPETPDLALSFKDEAGTVHTCSVGRNADDSEVVLGPLAE